MTDTTAPEIEVERYRPWGQKKTAYRARFAGDWLGWAADAPTASAAKAALLAEAATFHRHHRPTYVTGMVNGTGYVFVVRYMGEGSWGYDILRATDQPDVKAVPSSTIGAPSQAHAIRDARRHLAQVMWHPQMAQREIDTLLTFISEYQGETQDREGAEDFRSWIGFQRAYLHYASTHPDEPNLDTKAHDYGHQHRREFLPGAPWDWR